MAEGTTPETFTVPKDATGVSCDGGHSVFGHPKTWYSFTGKDKNFAVCHYCGRLFFKER